MIFQAVALFGRRGVVSDLLVPGAGLEPACRSSPARHFKCLVSTYFTTRAGGCPIRGTEARYLRAANLLRLTAIFRPR